MTSITYGHGQLYEFSAITGWSEGGGLGANGSFSVSNGDYFDLENTTPPQDYYVVNDTNINLSSATHTKIVWRYKTGNTSVKAQIIIEFSDASTQTVLAESTSTTFTAGSATITAAKTIDHVRLYANDDAGHVYYDFVMICAGIMTLPEADVMDVRGGRKQAVLAIPGRSTDVTQDLGGVNLEIDLAFDVSTGTWTRTGDTIRGEVFLDILNGINASGGTEQWQWFDSDLMQLKVSMVGFRFHQSADSSRVLWTFSLTLREYRLSDAANSLEDYSYKRRWGTDL